MSNSNPFAGPVDLDGYQRISGTCSDYDEIKLVNGGLVRTVSLIQVATNGARSLEFYLTYDAQSSLAPSSVGANWVHNYGASLTGLGTGVVTATLESGIPYHFIQEGSSDRYTLDTSTSSFIKANLTKQPGRWLLNFYPNGGYYQFDPNGVLQQMVDAHGNSLNLSYTGGKLSSVTESAGGRQITFGYTGSNLDSVTDPNGRTYVLQQDGSGNLTAVISTEGCMLLYGYANPASHLLTSRTDPNNNTYTYSYDGSRRLTQIADPLNNLLNYSYDTPQERVGDTGTINLPIFRTILVDARGNRWEYHFDTGGNLWRVIDPLHHWRRYYWTAEQNLIYSCSGHSQCEPIAAGTVGGPRDNTYNSFLRNVYDPRGNLLSTINSVGRVDQYEYDAGNRLISDFAGQGDIAVGGNWVGQYGEDGYLLCAWDSAGTDLAQLPDYISSITPTGVTKTNYNNFAVLTDPRALVGPDPAQSTEATRRGVGLWRNQGTPSSPGSFVVNLATSQAKSFNLSIYSHALDQSKPAWGILGPYQVAPSGGLYYQPLSYSEQFGCYLNYTVTDAKGTQNFVVYNNAPGMWATFPVTTTPEVPGVTITVTAVFNPDSGGVGTVQAQISALAFDPYSSRKIQRSYASSVYGQAVFGSDSYGSDGDLTQIVGPLGQKTSLTYNMDGTVATSTDSLGNTTRYFYGDSAKNLTSVVDPSGATWTMTYDNNGNLLTSENPNHHTTTMVYDGKNRLIRTTDALGNVTRLTYDPAGNLSSITDALDRTTLFDYTECNRLLRITDPLLGQTVYEYDPSGNLVAVTDPRGNRAQLVYDAAGRMIATIGADSQVVQYALDAQDRLVAVTTPNGTQSRLSSINTVNGGNWVRNASFEVRDPIVSSYNKAQFWQNLQGSVARDATHAHTGTYSQPFSLSAGVSQTLVQPSLALPPGGTFLANCWVEKAADGQAATINLSASLYDLQHAVQNLAGASTTLDGSQLTWQTLDLPWRLSVPGDSMATTFSTTRLALTASSSASTQVWVDDVSLTPLSTTYSYDQSGNVEEIRHPDGSRQRFYRDRWSRVVATEDARGNKTLTAYDDLDRIIALTDSLGYQTVFGYDANSNLISVTNAATTRVGTYGSARYGLSAYVGPGQEMQFFYNSRNLLSVMRYQDGTNEVFEYDPAGNLASYQDNQGRTRTFLYDDLERLTQVTYADATQVVFTYDAVSNVLTRLERNGDQTAFVHDALNRVVDEVRTLGGTAGVGWNHAQTFDAANNRTRFAFGASEYGSAIYGTDVYGPGPVTWNVDQPRYGTASYGADLYAGGYNARNQMPGYLDPLGNPVDFRYDVEGRRTQIVYPHGSPRIVTTATYDIVGRLLSQLTSQGANSLLSLTYGYDQASQRIAMVVGNDTFDYDLDAANRLTAVCQNLWVEQLPAHFALGTCNATVVDSAAPGVSLLALSDSFSGDTLNLDRWRLCYFNQGSRGLDFVGMEMRQRNGLVMTYPRGYTEYSYAARAAGWEESYGNWNDNFQFGAELRQQLTGDFDFQVDFSDFQALGVASGGGNSISQLALLANSNHMDDSLSWQIAMVRMNDGSGNDRYLAALNGGPASAASTDVSGKLRLERTGTQCKMSYFSGGSWVVLLNVNGGYAGPIWASLRLQNIQGTGGGRWSNFTVNLPSNSYVTTGTFTSSLYDSGQAAPTWGELSWQATLPGSTSVQFQLASSNSPNGPWTYLGPTGPASFYTSSGTAIPSVGAGAITGRYLRYQVTLAGPGTATPKLTQVMVTFAGTNPSTLYGYAYDSRGNMTDVTTQVAAGTATEVRTFNDLNQLLSNAVTPVGGGTTNWTYTWNLDGTLATKSDGTNTYAYTWDPGGDQRLLSMVLNSVTQVEFTYDSLGRMLTRTPYSGGVAQTATSFEWDHWDCVREFAPAGTYRYYAPQGELVTFDYTPTAGATSTYCLHSDALGSVRMITDSTGTVVARFDYDAWGNQLASSFDNVPGGMRYSWVGSLGVRFDDDSGLFYMRKRWYDPTLQSFISRDPFGIQGGANLYCYAAGTPLSLIDPYGLEPVGTTLLQDLGDLILGGVEIPAGAAITQADSPVPGPADVAGGIVATDGWRRVQRGSANIVMKAGIILWSMGKKKPDPTPVTPPKETPKKQPKREPHLGPDPGTGSSDSCQAKCYVIPIKDKKSKCPDNRQAQQLYGLYATGDFTTRVLCESSKGSIQMPEGRWYTRHCQCRCKSWNWQWRESEHWG